jgi:hypothetical protein
MTEEEWLACTDPLRMLEFLGERASERKLRLYDCACWRARAPHFWKSGGKQLLAAVLLAEDYADGAIRRVARAYRTYGFFCQEPRDAVRSTIGVLAWRPRLGVPAPVLCERLREVFGNPCLPAIDPSAWQADGDRTVVPLAQAIYEERAFDRMPILADALEDAGCTNEKLLGHLRGPGAHVRGCWAVDALLGKA